MKTYVVNMPKDVHKRDIIERQLKAMSELDCQIWAATEGRKLSVEQLEYYGYSEFAKKYGNFGTLPAFGCSVSHYSIYKDIVDTNESCSLILEDDALISPQLNDFIKSVSGFLTNIKEPLAILLTPDFIYHKGDIVYYEGESVKLVNVLHGYMTSGYIINKYGAELLVNNLFPIKYIADEWSEFKKFGLKVLGQVPHLVSYPDGIGEIGMSQLRVQESPWMNIRHLAGRIKGRIISQYMYMKGLRKSTKSW